MFAVNYCEELEIPARRCKEKIQYVVNGQECAAV